MESLLGVVADLNQLIPILVHWLHLLSAVVWIGGLAFLVMAVTPCLKTTVPKEFIKPISETFYRQYKRMVGLLLVVILFTGGASLHYVSQAMVMATGEGVAHHAKYLTVFFIKLFLVLGVLTIFLYTVLFKNDPTGHEDQEELEEMAVEPVPFQRFALWMGVFIILCASAMKHLHT
jgi:putative copper export protein